MFLVVWLGLNMLFGLGTVSIGGEDGQAIAWQAHIGGFFAGLLLFNAFDPVVPQAERTTEPSGISERIFRIRADHCTQVPVALQPRRGCNSTAMHVLCCRWNPAPV